MIQPTLLEKLEALPESLQKEVLHYAEFLLEKYASSSPQEAAAVKKRKAGLLKGKIKMADDFDAPLEEMKDYM